MNQSEKHNFEEEWRRAFDEASETPPPFIWNALEAQLDQPEKAAAPIVPLWRRSPRLWYAAAAVGALLLVSLPLLLRLDKGAQSQLPTVAVEKNRKESDDRLAGSAGTGAEAASATGAESATGQKKVTAPAEVTAPDTEPRYAASNRNADGRKASGEQRSLTLETISGSQVAAVPGTEVPATEVPGTEVPNAEVSGTSGLTTTPGQESTVPSTADSRLAATETSRSSAAGTSMVAIQIEALSPRGYRELAVYPQKRYVFYRYDSPQDDLPLSPPVRSKEYWAGVGVMPAAFNPAVNVTSPPAAFSAANAGRQSMTSSSRAGLSYALQTQGGMKLSKHWSLETGVSYLQGNSTFVSDGYVMDAMSNRSANVLENALMAGSPKANQSTSDFSFAPATPGANQMAAVYIDLDQQTSNDYRFLQLPVQAGYTLNPEGKLSYTVLGGMVANLFLRNDLETAPGYTLTTTASDGVYRGLNWSAATGVRLNYHLSSHWTASLTGSYQKALATGIQDNDNLSSRPQLYGLGWGVRYLF